MGINKPFNDLETETNYDALFKFKLQHCLLSPKKKNDLPSLLGGLVYFRTNSRLIS